MDIKIPSADPTLLIGQGRKPEGAGRDKKDTEGLRRTCQQFEAIFVQQLFKGMRATVPDAGVQESDRSIRIFQDLMDHQVSEDMARKEGLGIAEALFRQFRNSSP